MIKPLSKETLGLAGEYAVACELCKRDIYAQLTLGNRKEMEQVTGAGVWRLLYARSMPNRSWRELKGQ
ncbi:MAG: hypothetical protein PHP56_10455 [Smithellaceae bacterium]|nr:hypothetical protein [Smithellaceae bacterium]